MLDTLTNRHNIRFVMNWVLLFCTIIVLQVGLMPALTIAGSVPNLLITSIVLAALIFGYEIALPLALFAALIFSEMLCDRFFFLSWLIVPFLAVRTFPMLSLNSRVLIFLQVVLISLYVQILNAAIFSGFWEMNAFLLNPWLFIVEPLQNGLLSIPLLWTLERLFQLEETYNLS
ncbi:MAG: hypothetical protein SFT81_05340 [Candidatus Caenarcaniphilales bacterium]|nr:hypothetical protein [Candidatus Caenarcaniphilales bacterium]